MALYIYYIYIILTNARPRYKSQYRIEQNRSCVRFHLRLTNQVNVTVGGYVSPGVSHNYQLPPLFCCPVVYRTSILYRTRIRVRYDRTRTVHCKMRSMKFIQNYHNEHTKIGFGMLIVVILYEFHTSHFAVYGMAICIICV